jgi:glycosyltransferase involved in cell wall biosynthesis
LKILILNYYHYPAAGAHAFRWSALSEYFVKLGHQVTVITSPVKGATTTELYKGVSIIRVGAIKLDIVLRTDFEVKNHLPTRLLRLVKTVLRPVYRFFYWPDASWHWAPFVLRELNRNHKKNNYDVIVSYYPSFVAHISAYIFKRFQNKKSIWVMDYGDPFSISYNWQPNNFFLFKKINFIFERIFFSRSYQSFTNDQTLEEYSRVLSIKNSFVMPNLVNVEDFYSQDQNIIHDKDIINMYYLGSFYKNFREPYSLIKIVERLNKISKYKFILNIIGPDHGFSSFFNRYNFIKYSGPVTRQDAKDIIKNSPILVNVENQDCVMTPSKVVEYIASGRPILNILNGEPDYLPKATYEKFGFLINANDSLGQVQLETLEKKLIFLSSKRSLEINKVYTCLHPAHTLEGIGSQYLRIFERPVNNSMPVNTSRID